MSPKSSCARSSARFSSEMMLMALIGQILRKKAMMIPTY